MAEARDPAAAEVADSADRQPDFKLEIQALQILDSSDDCIKVLDLEGHILFMSRGGQVLLGIQDITPFLNTSWIEFWQGADRQSAIEATARARAGKVSTFQGYCPTPSSEPKWWECKVSPMRGIDGQVERLLCISRDITERRQIEDERKQAEEKLRESEERYRAIINQAVTGVVCGDFDGNLTLVNQKYCDITGYCADELTKLRMQDFTHPEDLPRNLELFHRMGTEGTPFEIEKRYIRKDGSIVWVNNSVSAIRDRDGKPQSAVAIVLDITDRKQAELSAEFLATVTQDLAEATCVEEIIQTFGERLNQYLQTSNCAFVEINESKDVAAIHHSWHLKEVPSLVGVYRLAEFVTDEFLQTAKAGRTIVVRDVTTDPRIAEPERFTSLKIGSFINVPLIRDNEWKFTLNIYHQTPYNWRSNEIELMRELANRIWTKLERTRVKIALRQSQEMFSTLVADAPFGVYAIDAEFRLRQANQAAIGTFNIQPLIGRDLAEALRIIWQEPFATEAIDRFRHTLATGESFYSPPVVEPRADIAEIQSYDWQLHRITLADGSYGVVCYFYDLSEIKRAEEIIRRNGDRDAFLVTLNDALRPLNDPIEIQATANRVLGEYLQTARVTYFEVRGADYFVGQDYVNGVESLRGGYSIESFGPDLLATYRSGVTAMSADVAADPNLSLAERSAYAGIQIAAYIGVPLVKQGDFVAGLAVHSATPRNWTPEEIALAEEVAERTWAAVERARAEAALRESEEALATDLANAELLRELAERLVSEENVTTIYDEILSTTLAIAPFDAGTIHIYDPQTKSLELIASKNFSRTITDYFYRVDASSRTACGIATNTGQRAFVDFPDEVADFGCQLLVDEGFQAALALPLVSRTGTPLGMLNAHWRQTRHRPTDRELRFLDLLARQAADLLEQRQAKAALRKSEAKYRSLFESMDEAYAVVEVMAGENGEWNDFLFLEVNPAFVKQTGIEYPVGRTATELLGTPNPRWAQIYGRVAETGEPIRLEEGEATLGRVFDLYVFRLEGEDSHRVAVLFTDITDRKRGEEQLRRAAQRDAFRVKLSDALRSLSDPVQIQAEACRLLGEQLGVDRAYYVEIYEAQRYARVNQHYSRGDSPSIVGDYPLAEYGWSLQIMRRGETIVIADTQSSNIVPDAERAAMATIQMVGFVALPLINGEVLVGALTLNEPTPREWTEAEVDLVRETAERLWADIQRAHAEIALRESEKKYRSLFDSIDAGFSIFEMVYNEVGEAIDFRYIETNPAFDRQSGRRPQPGQTMRELFSEAEDRWLKDYAEVARTGQAKRFIDFHQELDRWFDVFVFPSSNGKNQLAALFSDVTEEKRSEAALRESQERLHKAISIETVGVLFFTLEGHITDANDTFLRMSGYSRDELRNIADWQELTPPEFWDATSGAAEELAILGKAAPYEKQLIRKDGSRWWGLFSPTRLKGSGRNAECVEFVTDISDRKQTEAAIAADLRDTQLLCDLSARLATEESIQALYQEIMATAIALTQADAGTVQILDETTQDLVLLATQGFKRSVIEQFHRVKPTSHTSCGIALRSGVRSFVDFDVPASEDPDGAMRLHVEGGLLSAQSTPLISRSGKRIGMVSTHWRTRHRPSDRELRFLDLLARQAADLIEQRQDAAQRKQLLEREQAAREEAEQANRIKDEFLAVLSHELRSPLTPILGWSTLLLNGKIEATKTTQALSTIQRNAKLQSELIEDLLDIARIMRGKLSINVAPVNLAFTIRSAMETVRLAAEAKSIQIAASLTEDVGLVLGDSTRLQQVVWNLLSNAVKFTPAGGQVSIRLERFDSSAQITVSDTGQGIVPDFLPYVFDYFRQADGATTRKFGGLGLGLAIVRQLVELHGGTVSVASPGLGQGTTFTVRVPLKSASSETNQDVRSTQQFLDLSGIKILIVDDETDIRELVAFVLEQQGAEVIVATCAREALLVLPQAKPDILLSDIGMPEMDGYMLIRQMRTLTPEQGGDIPAIAVTAYAGDTHQQQVLAAGFQKHISKPIQPQVLVQAIADLIHSRRA
jgi:PAS domain S-box-containing protein